ncbi:poly-gamma-glutamate hydrolase family protein [Halogranum rubrum]|uniref:Phage-related replication protein n=1 Tax=Halogranum salarium B-1 TaxID=1210908 RepID=J3JEJ6_9EURY|nr:poly-gamma-glutamate hydrolase family protein [Halogranum salarium]EJN58419.1 hypothetical protein HSB1_38360 [Halogranum salarium B-1]
MTNLTRRSFLASGAVFGIGGIETRSSSLSTLRSESETTLRLKTSGTVESKDVCYLPRSFAADCGVSEGQQVRLYYNGDPALFTVCLHDGKFGAVSEGGRGRLGASSGSYVVDVDTQVVHPSIGREAASERGEFIERVVSGASSVVALAPHGGYIEYGTDSQAVWFAERCGATAWYCSGWWPEGGAYRRWHVPSTEIHPASFPKLEQIAGSGFDAAVSFHGWSEPHLAVGGTASEERRVEIRDAIEAVTEGAFEVRLSTDATRSGTASDNVVNRLTTSGRDGVQIEQPSLAREEYGQCIAEAVADVFASRVE